MDISTGSRVLFGNRQQIQTSSTPCTFPAKERETSSLFCAGHQTENNRAKIYKDDIPFPSLSFRRLDCLEVRLERYSATFQSTEGSARYHHSARLIALDKKQALHTHHYHMRGVTRAFLCRDLLLLRNTSSLALLPLPPGHLFSFFLPVEVTGRWGRRGRESSHLVPILSYLLLRSSSRSLSLWRHRQGCLFVWLCFFSLSLLYER